MILPTTITLTLITLHHTLAHINPQICTDPVKCDWILPQTTNNSFIVKKNSNIVVLRTLYHNADHENQGVISSVPLAIPTLTPPKKTTSKVTSANGTTTTESTTNKTTTDVTTPNKTTTDVTTPNKTTTDVTTPNKTTTDVTTPNKTTTDVTTPNKTTTELTTPNMTTTNESTSNMTTSQDTRRSTPNEPTYHTTRMKTTRSRPPRTRPKPTLFCKLTVIVTFNITDNVERNLSLKIQVVTKTRSNKSTIESKLDYEKLSGSVWRASTKFSLSSKWPFLIVVRASLGVGEPWRWFSVHNITLRGCHVGYLFFLSRCGGAALYYNTSHQCRLQYFFYFTSHHFRPLQQLGHYLYFTSKGLRGLRGAGLATVRLRSSLFPMPPPATSDKNSSDFKSCKVSFAYHRWGHVRPTPVILYVRKPCAIKGADDNLGIVTRRYADKWFTVTIPLIINAPFMLQFEGRPRKRFMLQFEGRPRKRYVQDVALDDIFLSPQCFGIGLTSTTRSTNISTNTSHIISHLPPQYSNIFYSNNEPRICDLYHNISRVAVHSFIYQTIPEAERKEVEFVLSSCGATGRTGPTQDQCDKAYTGVPFTIRVMKDGKWPGVQVWTVEHTSRYIIHAQGARGGMTLTNLPSSNLIGFVTSHFNLTRGEKIYFLVGQPGGDACDRKKIEVCNTENASYVGGGGGGGGASYVFKIDNVTGEVVLLLVASGANGASLRSSNSSGHGGGFNTSMPTNMTGRSLKVGGKGGVACKNSTWPADGGFGGGGGACAAGGGGAGYKGGSVDQKAQNYISDMYQYSLSEYTLPTSPAEISIKRLYPCLCEEACLINNITTGTYTCDCLYGGILAADGISCTTDTVPRDWTQVTESVTITHPETTTQASINIGIIISVALAVFLVFSFIVALFCFCKYWRRHKRAAKSPQMPDLFPLPPGQILASDPSCPSRRVQYNPNYFSNQDLTPVPREMLVLLEPLGQGAFGLVYHGVMLKDVGEADKQEHQVAVKTLPENSTEQAEMDFLMEAIILSKFNHDNIVHFIGVCFEMHPRYIVLELLEGGDLKSFLRENRNKSATPNAITVTISNLIKLSLDIANGCRHLEENHFIHRDIAARNCLLTSKTTDRVAKIADFGMSRDIYRADYYKKGGKAVLPVKWMPPEAFMDGIFTTKTDVWSFGVLLWEVFSMGLMPYPWLGNYEVMEFVMSGGRMDLPENCAATVYNLMLHCWDSNAEHRPSFSDIINTLIKFSQDQDVLSRELPMYQDYRIKKRVINPTPSGNACVPTPTDDTPTVETTQSPDSLDPPLNTPGSTAPLLSDIEESTSTNKKHESPFNRSQHETDQPSHSPASGKFAYHKIPTSDYDMPTLDSRQKSESLDKIPSNKKPANSYVNDIHIPPDTTTDPHTTTDPSSDGVSETTFSFPNVQTHEPTVVRNDPTAIKNIREFCSLSLEQLPRKQFIKDNLTNLRNSEKSSSLRKDLDMGGLRGHDKLGLSYSLKSRSRSSPNVEDKVSRSLSDRIRSKKQMYDADNYLVPRVTFPECDNINCVPESCSPLLEACENLV